VTVFIDTTGRSPHDLADQHEVSDYLSSRPDISKCLVLPATYNPTDAANTIEKFGVYGPDCVAVTKVDETLRPGSIIDVLFEYDLPLSFLCTGQRVPEDIAEASAEFIAGEILGAGN
jgi:flagellar biosynthesis protein FlhF